MMWARTGALGGAFLGGVLAAVYYAGPALGSGPVTAIEVAATPVPLSRADPAADRVGRLRYMGGLELRSGDQRFGGISALLWEPGCNRLLAATDSGNWVVLEPDEKEGRLTGVRAAWLAPLLDAEGKAARSKVDADAESLARASDGTILVGYEVDHRIHAYRGVSACRPDSLAAPAWRWDLPEMKGWPANGGAEAMATRGASVLVIAEFAQAPSGGRIGLLAEPAGAAARAFAYVPPAGHEPTAADGLDPVGDPGRFLLLHRRFTPLSGVSAVVAEADVPESPTAPVVAQEVARLAPPFSVDNMEGLAVRADGARRFVYLVSDNNFNPLQRTLLLKFELLPGADAGTPR